MRLFGIVPFKRAALHALFVTTTAFRFITYGATAPVTNKTAELGAPQDLVEEAVRPGVEAEPGLVQDDEQNEADDEAKSISDPNPATPQRGHWGVNVGLTGRSFYDSNIFIQPSHPQGDWLNQIEPSIHFGLGDYVDRTESFLALEYTARASLYASHPDEDSLDHDVLLSVLKQISQLDVGLSVQVKTATEPNIDAGNLDQSELYQAALHLRYELTGRTALESDSMAREMEYPGLLSSREIRITEWYVYQLTSRLDQSVGVTYGHLSVSEGSRQTYEQVLSRTRLLENSLVTAGLSVGVENRQYEGTTKTKVNPLLALDFDYDSHAGCTFHVEAFRKTDSSSLLVDQNRIQTGLQASCRQHLAPHWSAALAAEVEQVDYTSTNDTVTGSRRDLVYALRASPVYEPNEHWSAAPFVQFRRNDSNEDKFSFTDFQAGIVIKATF